MEIIAHRGASARAPENTLAAFRLAWACGADGIEMDVHLSRDRRVMVHHDEGTRRTAGVDLAIASTDSEVLRGLDVGRWRGKAFAGERMPFLEEVIATAAPGARVLIEVKCGPQIVPALETVLEKAVPGPRVAIISMDLDTLAACRVALPGIPCYWVVACAKPVPRGVFPAHSPRLVELALARGLAGLDPDYHGITAEFAAAVRAAGLGLITWTVNRPRAARRLREFGVEALTTDRPAEMRRALSA